MNHGVIAAAFSLAAAHAWAQPAPDAARADQAVPATRYESPLGAFRPARDPAQPPSSTWSAANAIVAGQGGMHGMHHAAPATDQDRAPPPAEHAHHHHQQPPQAGKERP